MPSMRTFFPPAKKAPSARASLQRALLLGILLVVVWTAVAYLPEPQAPPQTDVQAVALTADPLQSDASQAGPTTSGMLPTEDGSAALKPVSLIGPGYMMVLLLLGFGGVGALWLRQKKGGAASVRFLTEIGRHRVGPQQEIQLIRCAGEVLLIGTSSSGVSLLKAYPASVFPVQAPVQAQPGPSADTVPALPPADSYPEGPVNPAPAGTPEEDIPEWTVATASAISDGPDFMHVLRRYAGKKTYKANTLYPPTGATN
ncbi:MAG: flagellar biogenesis protein FliO [Rhodothermales bacterium]|jgi:flagellar biogenesis protein FliO